MTYTDSVHKQATNMAIRHQQVKYCGHTVAGRDVFRAKRKTEKRLVCRCEFLDPVK